MTPKTVDQLRRGARIHSLVYAAYLGRSPPRLYDVTWQGLVYHRCNAKGARGFVGFSKLGAVAMFYDPEVKPPGKPDALMQGMPDALRAHVRREKLGDVLDTVTAIFWSNPAGELLGARPWPKLVKEGAHLVEAEVEKTDKAIVTLAEQYALGPEQTDAVKAAFGSKVKIVPSGARVTIPAAEQTALRLVMNQATRELLQGAGIELA